MNQHPIQLPTNLEECHQLIRELTQIIHQLSQRVDKLEKENRELRERLNTDSNNSSKPPSSDFKRNKKHKKKSSGNPSGGQKGHPGHFRQLIEETEVDEIVSCEAFSACERCGGNVQSRGGYMRHQVHELPEIKLHVTEYRIAHGECCCCSQKQLANLPEGLSFGITGPRLTSLMSMLVAKYQLSRRGLQEFLAQHLNFKISLGTIFNKQRLVNQVLEAPVNALLPVIKQEVCTNIDETSHRQSGENHWLWVVTGKQAAYFEVTASRGKKIVKTLMEGSESIVISDRYAAYNYFDGQRQLCWSHLVRDFTRLEQKEDKVLSRIGKGLLECESRLFLLWHRFKKLKLSREELQRQTTPVIRMIGEYLEQGSYTAPELKMSRFCKNILERFSALWTFLNVEGVEPTNNHAERCLRPWVIWRKKYFGTQSDYGSEYVARSASMLMTSKLQQKNPFLYLTQAIRHQFSGKEIPLLLGA